MNINEPILRLNAYKALQIVRRRIGSGREESKEDQAEYRDGSDIGQKIGRFQHSEHISRPVYQNSGEQRHARHKRNIHNGVLQRVLQSNTQHTIRKHSGKVSEPNELSRSEHVPFIEAQINHVDPGREAKDDEHDQVHRDIGIPLEGLPEPFGKRFAPPDLRFRCCETLAHHIEHLLLDSAH